MRNVANRNINWLFQDVINQEECTGIELGCSAITLMSYIREEVLDTRLSVIGIEESVKRIEEVVVSTNKKLSSRTTVAKVRNKIIMMSCMLYEDNVFAHFFACHQCHMKTMS
jgi:hypothetical protein